jgi:regulator of sigma E protease
MRKITIDLLERNAMLNLLFSIGSAIVAIGIIVSVHEFGHYWVARRCGMRVETFSIGFGRALWQKQLKHCTVVKIGWIPLGGYVKLFGDEVTTPASDNPSSFTNQPIWQRFLVVLAGPMINFLLAIVIFWCLYLIGIPALRPLVSAITPRSAAATAQLTPGNIITHIDGLATRSISRANLVLLLHLGNRAPITITTQNPNTKQRQQHQLSLSSIDLAKLDQSLFGQLGLQLARPRALNSIAKVIKDSPADQAGLQVNDRIIKLNHYEIKNFNDIITTLQQHKINQITIKRHHRTLTIKINPKQITVNKQKRVMLGIAPKLIWPEHLRYNERYPFWQAGQAAVSETWLMLHLNIATLTKLIQGKLPLELLGGPVMIFSSAANTAKMGLVPYLFFIAYISIAIGFLNLLPIPPLDGGHILLQAVEAIKGKAVSAKWQLRWSAVGFSLLLLLMFIATKNDVLRMW